MYISNVKIKQAALSVKIRLTRCSRLALFAATASRRWLSASWFQIKLVCFGNDQIDVLDFRKLIQVSVDVQMFENGITLENEGVKCSFSCFLIGSSFARLRSIKVLSQDRAPLSENVFSVIHRGRLHWGLVNSSKHRSRDIFHCSVWLFQAEDAQELCLLVRRGPSHFQW